LIFLLYCYLLPPPPPPTPAAAAAAATATATTTTTTTITVVSIFRPTSTKPQAELIRVMLSEDAATAVYSHDEKRQNNDSGQVVHIHASVTKQYNLVLAKNQ